jgi:hypothetical protein
MTVEDVSTCQMTPEAARLAKRREYDGLSRLLEDPIRLLAAIEKEKRWTRDCFYIFWAPRQGALREPSDPLLPRRVGMSPRRTAMGRAGYRSL